MMAVMIIIVMKIDIDIKKEIGVQENSIDAEKQEKKISLHRQLVLV